MATNVPNSIILNDVEYFITDKIGEGAYGNVHQCKAKSEKELAVKCIPVGKSGMPCLMEASIMSSVKHKFINNSNDVQLKNKNLCIVQEKAICDLHGIGKGEKIDLYWVLRWGYELLQAIECLHKQGLVHADVKASNVLMFSDNSIKLADFTLTIKIDRDHYPTHTVCTVTHRPVEVLSGSRWSYPVDVWSYGCTLYEIAYGESLFPYQGHEPNDKSYKAMNCILDWRKEKDNDLYQPDVEFKKVSYPARYHDPSMASLNRFIHYILRIHPNDRPTTKDMLNNPIFKDMKPYPYVYPYPKIKDLPQAEKELVQGWLNDKFTSPKLKGHIYMLFIRCEELDMPSYDKLNACATITCKLYHKATDIRSRIDYENRICRHLNYRLHW
jgi:serine/threonine protein kinase